MGQCCQGQAQEITVEVILCKYSRQSVAHFLCSRYALAAMLVFGKRGPDELAQERKAQQSESSEAMYGYIRIVGSSSQADHLMRNAAMDDSIGGS